MKKFFILLLFPLCFSNSEAGTSPPKTFGVKVVGKGTPMILIPGYSCSGEVWDETVKHFSGKYECHVLTLAGFAGAPAVTNTSLEKVKNEIIKYVKEKKLSQPILVGHSLGGMLSVWLAASEPTLFSKVIVVDALPFFPLAFNPNATLEKSKPEAEKMKTKILKTASTEADTKQSLQWMITDSANIALATKWSLASDKNTMAQYIYDMMTTDLRSQLPKIKIPVLVLGSWVSTKMYGGSKETTRENYADDYKGLANYKVIIANKAKHFIMLDEPEWFYKQVETFLQ